MRKAQRDPNDHTTILRLLVNDKSNKDYEGEGAKAVSDKNTTTEQVGNLVDAAPTPVSEELQPDKSNWSGIAIIGLVLVLAAIGFFFLQQLRSDQEGLGGELERDDRKIMQIGDQMTNLQSQVSIIQSQMATLQSSLTNKETKFERSLTEFTERHGEKLNLAKEELSKSIKEIHYQLGKTRGDWMVADAEYLLTVANQRLHLVGDIKTSLIALQAADQRLRESGNPGVFKVREAIAREVNILKDIKPLDIVGIISKIRALENEVARLPIFLPHAEKDSLADEATKSNTEEKELSSMEQLVESALEDIKGLVVIRRTGRSVTAVLLPEEVALIREDLKIKLEIARLALVQRDGNIYRANLEDAKAWLLEHFENNASATKKFLAEINKLQNIAVEMEFPNISESLSLLQNVATLRLETEKKQLEAGRNKQEETP